MTSRRNFVFGSLAAVGGAAALPACSTLRHSESYADVAERTWRHGAVVAGDKAALLRELVRCATLAPSSHNTQCWQFCLEQSAVTILPDLSRRCPVVDPDDHHLFVSLGCAAENLIQAASANGLHADAQFDAARANALRVNLEATKPQASALFEAIPERQCTRGDYDGQPLSRQELALLEQAGSGDGVRVLLLSEKQALEQVLEYVVAGNTAQMNDPAFVAELRKWLRFSGDEAVRTGDGLYAAASGNPSVPEWLGSLLFGAFFRPKSENDKYARQVRSSAGIAVFVSDAPGPAQWIEVGRGYERFALQSAALGIRNAMLNQPLEVSRLRPQFADFLGLGGRRPDLVVRFGRGPKLPSSLRRPLPAVLV
ncbi:Acg family FMN-binding oxidoreductase [Rhodocyclus tenuis]|uniref:Acg family FMN-binding oxidoreductase n=1 Tax=Rhodocyclus tenuis TaxID=1066 RepID=UPI001906490B|nr:Tat pathway signal protein [Rhodocyclus tenuis]MBK1681084.1 Tat pathway signal protein [Rhodocyclus tenuis]